MKKILISLLVLVMICSFGLAGCGSSASDEAQQEDAAVTEEQEAVEEVEAEVEDEAEEAAAEATEVVKQEESKTAASTQKKTTNTTQKAASTTQQAQTQPAAQAQAPATEKKTGTKADAESYTGKSLSDFTAEYGQPNSSSYSDSCLGDGQDGEHHYDGYTVYTYTENGEEKIQGVE